MIISLINNEAIYNREPSLRRFLGADQINFDSLINDSFDELCTFLQEGKVSLKGLMTPLSLSTSKSDEDILERRLLVCEVSSVTDEAYVIIQGTNDESNETYTTVRNDIIITDAGTFTFLLNKLFRFYKIEVTGTLTHETYLVETSFYYAQLYLTLSNIYQSLTRVNNDVYSEKAIHYRKKFEDAYSSMIYSVDNNLDNEIDIDEKSNSNVREIYR